jgi:hypothetical protein
MSLISSRRIGNSLLFWCSCGLLFAQDTPAPPDKCLLEGKVLNSATGEPVRKAQVALMDIGGSTFTDAAGRFQFTDLKAGRYILSASHDGYAFGTVHGRLNLLHLALAPGEEKRDIVIHLAPLSAVTGRILDEDGDPIRQIEVQMMAYRYTASGRQLEGRSASVTNDLGEYRVFDVPPGRYYLRASPPGMMSGGHGQAYGASYYPGTPDSTAAATIEIGGGQKLEGIDLTLRPTRSANVRGRVMNPGNNLMVGLLKVTEDGGSSSANTGVHDPDGKFVLRGVSPGSYFLTAESNMAGQPWSAQLPIQVGAADLEGIELHLQPPMEIAGQIRIEGKSSDKLSSLTIVMESGGQTRMAGGGTRADGSFLFHGLEPAVYQVSAQAPPDLYLKIGALVGPGCDAVRCGFKPGSGRVPADGGDERQRRANRWGGCRRSIGAGRRRHSDVGTLRHDSEILVQIREEQLPRRFPHARDRTRDLQTVRLGGC